MLGEFIVKKEGEAENQTRREAGTVNQPHLGFLYWTDSDTCHPPIAPSIWHISKEQIVNHKEMKLITTPPASDWKQPLMTREITARRRPPLPPPLPLPSKPAEVVFKVRTNLPAHRAQ